MLNLGKRSLLFLAATTVAAVPAARGQQGYLRHESITRPGLYYRPPAPAQAAPVTVSRSGTARPASDRAAPTGPPEEASKPVPGPLADRSAAVSGRLHSATEELERDIATLREDIAKSIDAAKSAPDLSVLDEGQRHRLFTRYLGEVVALGEKAIADEQAFSRLYESFLGVSTEAAAAFREAEAHFRGRALASKGEKARELNEKISRWYAARGAAAEAVKAVTKPGDYRQKFEEVGETVETCRELHRWLLKDEHFFQESDIQAELAEFFEAVLDVNEVLGSWTELLIKNADDQRRLESAPVPAPVPASPPASAGSGAMARFTAHSPARGAKP